MWYIKSHPQIFQDLQCTQLRHAWFSKDINIFSLENFVINFTFRFFLAHYSNSRLTRWLHFLPQSKWKWKFLKIRLTFRTTVNNSRFCRSCETLSIWNDLWLYPTPPSIISFAQNTSSKYFDNVRIRTDTHSPAVSDSVAYESQNFTTTPASLHGVYAHISSSWHDTWGLTTAVRTILTWERRLL